MAKAWKSFSILIVLALVFSMGLMASVLCGPPEASAQPGWSMFFAEAYEMEYSQWDSTTDEEIWVSIMYEDQTVKHVQLTDTPEYGEEEEDEADPSIAVAPNGNIIVAWEQPTEVEPGQWEDQIYCSILNRSGTVVKADIALTSSADYQNCDPSVAVTPDGKVFVVWEPEISGDNPVGYAILDTIGNILTPETRIFRVGDIDDPTVATSTKNAANNNVVIAWEEYDGSDDQVWFTILDSAGNTLVANTRVTNTSEYSDEINAAILPGGNFAIVWDESDGSVDQVWFTIRDATGNTVKANTQLTISTEYSSDDPAVAATPGGNIVIVWEEYVSGQNYNVFYTILDSSGNMVKAIAQVTTSSMDDDDCDVAIDQNGSMVISWEDEIASDRVSFAILNTDGTIIATDLALTDGTHNIDLDGGEGRRNVATMPTPARPVGGGAYTPDKLAILAPWVALALAILSGTTIVIRRRRARS